MTRVRQFYQVMGWDDDFYLIECVSPCFIVCKQRKIYYSVPKLGRPTTHTLAHGRWWAPVPNSRQCPAEVRQFPAQIAVNYTILGLVPFGVDVDAVTYVLLHDVRILVLRYVTFERPHSNSEKVTVLFTKYSK
jgi:hypothetical protein